MAQDKKTDRRVRRTKRALREALANRMLEKNLQEITVKEISEIANINRGTFYLHYKDVYDLYAQVQEDVLGEFEQLLEKHEADRTHGQLYPLVLDAFKFLTDNAVFCRAILKTDNIGFLTRLFDLFKPKTPGDWEMLYGPNCTMHDYSHAFVTFGAVGLLRAWLEGGMRESPEEMARLTNAMVKNALSQTQI